MTAANRAFYSLLIAAGSIGLILGLATLRLLMLPASDERSPSHALGRWCLLLITGSSGLDEILILVLLAFLPTALLLGLYTAVQQWWSTRRLLRAWLPRRLGRSPAGLWRRADRLHLAHVLDVVRVEQPAAFCYGFFRPRICLTTGLLDLLTDAELEAVLLHERHHLRNRDPLKQFVARSVGRAIFFLPLIGELARHFGVTKEFAADQSVIREQGHGRQLASALYKLIAASSAAESAAAVAGAVGATSARIDYLLDPRAAHRFAFSPAAIATSTFIALALVAIAVTSAFAGAGLHVHAPPPSARATCLV